MPESTKSCQIMKYIELESVDNQATLHTQVVSI